MSKDNNIKLNPAEIKAIENVVSIGDRVEIIPVKYGVKIMHIKRKEIKSNNAKQK